MGMFEFILVLVVITTFGKLGTAAIKPLAGGWGELMREKAAEHRARRKALESGVRLDSEVVEELETRLARIDERLDFLEQLRSPATRPSLQPPEDKEEP